MASKKAIITHLTALQEIASMTVLCSDKTGTLTTADMRVTPSEIWTMGEYSKDDALIWSGVASNPANKEDPIDSSVLKSCVEHFGERESEAKLAQYKKNKFIGFNPTTKRTVVYCEQPSNPKHRNFKIAKGLVSKILKTGDDGGDCWEVENLETVQEKVQEHDLKLSMQGYKTIGVALSVDEGPMKFAAIVPMMDPPRGDTMLTIYRIRQAAIGVKMITGDHLNVAVETARQIGLGTAILPATELWPASSERDETILTSDGFAQVLPKDKREVILVLQNRGLVVGMTGDGVNDAPALAQAQIGIAVDGATEAARSAADIILTTPGLSAIYDAVVESRKIFARLRAYVLYRMAATIQIVLVLSIMIYGYNVVMNPLYVILLALFNDVTMLPIADDNANPSSKPEIPSMPQILLASVLYGAFLTAQSLGAFEIALHSNWLSGDHKSCASGSDCTYISTLLYLQISIAIEFVIFSCRVPGFVLAPKFVCGDGRPSWKLVFGVMFANVVVTVLAGLGWIISKVEWIDILYVWVYNVIGLLVVDLLKVILAKVGAPWMSAGASSTILGYPELSDAEPLTNLGSRLSRVNERSILRNSVNRSNLLSHSGGVQERSCEPKAASMLPFPYNMRANAERNYRSF
jgi:H+-transporting ATPase